MMLLSSTTFLSLFVIVSAIPQVPTTPASSSAAIPTTPTSSLASVTPIPTTAQGSTDDPICVTVTVAPGGSPSATAPGGTTTSFTITQSTDDSVPSPTSETEDIGGTESLVDLSRRQVTTSSFIDATDTDSETVISSTSVDATTSVDDSTPVSVTSTASPTPCTITVTRAPTPSTSPVSRTSTSSRQSTTTTSSNSGNNTSAAQNPGNSAAYLGVSGGWTTTILAGILAALI